jgi:Ca2+-binding EF-hand superfamily protein
LEVLDVNQDGFVTYTELQKTLQSVGHRLTPWEMSSMLLSVDTDGDHMLNMSEFRVLYDSMGGAKLKKIGELVEELNTVWTLLDRDNDGQVTVEEIVGVFMQLGIQVPFSEVGAAPLEYFILFSKLILFFM